MGKGADGGLRENLGAVVVVVGGLGGTINCGVEGVDGVEGVVGVGKDGEVILAAFKVVGCGLHPYRLWTTL